MGSVDGGKASGVMGLCRERAEAKMGEWHLQVRVMGTRVSIISFLYFSLCLNCS